MEFNVWLEIKDDTENCSLAKIPVGQLIGYHKSCFLKDFKKSSEEQNLKFFTYSMAKFLAKKIKESNKLNNNEVVILITEKRVAFQVFKRKDKNYFFEFEIHDYTLMVSKEVIVFDISSLIKK